MHNSLMLPQRHFWNSFWGICVLITLVVLVRAWNLQLLYTDPTVREQTKIAMETVAEREGWLISDMHVQKVTRDWLVVHHRQHVRGPDPTSCYTIAFDSLELSPCSF